MVADFVFVESSWLFADVHSCPAVEVTSGIWLSRGFGEPVTSRRAMPALANWTVKNTVTEEVKVGATVHLALEQLEACDLPCGLPLTPG